MANTIGQFGFIRIDGQLQIPRRTHTLEARAGVDGTSVWHTGLRADPERLITVVDMPNEILAYQTYLNYLTLQQSIVAIERNGIVWPNVDYLILDVVKQQIRNHIAAVGGFYSGVSLLICAWDVLAIPKG